jgi:2-dehydropantoate 2-reductase
VERLRVLSFGAGAIGTYIGGSLAWKGHQVTFIEQAQVVEELRQKGLRLDFGKYGDRGVKAIVIPSMEVGLYASLADVLRNGTFDVALFALKSFDTDSTLEGIRPFASQMPPVLCLQNGVENEAKIAAVLGPDNVLYGSVGSAIGRRAAGDVVLEKYRGIGIGAGNPLSLKLYRAFDEALLNPKLFPHPVDMKWSKMLGNQLTSATSAILNMTPDEVLADNALYDLEMAQLRETLAVMKALGIKAIDLPGTPTAKLALAVNLPRPIIQPLLIKFGGGSRGEKMPSFHIDLHGGRGKSEVEYLHGAVVRSGEKMGVPTPVNRALTETLLSLTRGEVPVATFDHQPMKLLAKISA